MELKEALQGLEELQKKMYAYGVAGSALYLDSVTVAPRDTAGGRGVALGVLALLVFFPNVFIAIPKFLFPSVF